MYFLFPKIFLGFFIHREWQVLAHIFKAFVGIGVLGLPSAVMHGGLVVRNLFVYLAYLLISQLVFACSKLTIETLEQGVKYDQS